MKNCNCWACRLTQEQRFLLNVRRSAHNPTCPLYAEHGDPVKNANDYELRRRYEEHFDLAAAQDGMLQLFDEILHDSEQAAKVEVAIAALTSAAMDAGRREGLVAGAVWLYELHRLEDVSGVSGTGVVADATEFPNGRVAVAFRPGPLGVSSVTVYNSLLDAEKVHGHGGKSQFRAVRGAGGSDEH